MAKKAAKEKQINTQEIGFVRGIKEFLIYLDGLPSVKVNDVITSKAGAKAYVSSLLPDRIEALILEGEVLPGEVFSPLGEPLSLPVGDFLLGRAISPLGKVLDDGGPLISPGEETDLTAMKKEAPGIGQRQFITAQFETGIGLIDTLVPVGKGQRELVIGDARSGKTSFLLDLLVNQKYTGTICVYGIIGKPLSELKSILEVMRKYSASDYTVVVASFSSDSEGMAFLTPQTVMTVAEYFAAKGRDVVAILDDMGTHAKIYREISLISERFPGREAYPGDMFHEHARVLERAGKFSEAYGGGSITAFPVIELDLGDFTSFIPTNLMSMTDGHILFRSTLYNQGRRPAVDLSLSVSRVGRQTQNFLQSSLAEKIRAVMARAENLETLSGFGAELPPETQRVLTQKALLIEVLKQSPLVYLPKPLQLAILGLPFTKFFADKNLTYATGFKQVFIDRAFSDKKFLSQVEDLGRSATEKEFFEKLENQVGELAKSTGLTSYEPAPVVDEMTWLPTI